MTASSRPSFDHPYRWVILGAAVFAQATASVVCQGVYSLVPFFQQAFGLSQAGAALSVTAINAGQVASMLLMGWGIDRFGERRVVGITMVGMGGAAIGASLSTGYPALLAWLLLLGACYASVQPGGTTAMLRWFAPAQRGMATGVRQAALPLGTALAAVALPVIASGYGWHRALLVQGLVGIAGGLGFAFVYRGAEATGSGTRPPNPVQLVRDVLAYRALWPVMLAGVAMVTFQFTFAAHVLSFLTQRFGVSIVTAGLLFSITQWVGIAGRIAVAWVSDHYWPQRRMRSLVFTMCMCIAATLMLTVVPATTPTWLLVLLFVVVGLFGVGWFPLYLLQVAEMAPSTAVASTISFSMMLNMAAIAVVPPLFGGIVDLAGFGWAWLALAGLVALATVNLQRAQRYGRSAAAS